jgi:hypothetical protein
VVAVGALPSCLLLSTKGKTHLAATQWAQSLLDERRARPFRSLPNGGQTETLPPQLVYGTGIEMRARIIYSTVIGYDPSHLRHLHLTITWPERGQMQQIQHEADLVGLEQ